MSVLAIFSVAVVASFIRDAVLWRGGFSKDGRQWKQVAECKYWLRWYDWKRYFEQFEVSRNLWSADNHRIFLLWNTNWLTKAWPCVREVLHVFGR